MKRTSLLSAFALAIGFAAYPAAASNFEPIRVTLPYAVTFGGVTLASGDYTVVDVRDNGSSSVIKLQSAGDGRSALALANRISASGNDGASQTKLVMYHTGEKYELDRIWVKGSYGFEFSTASHHE